MGARLTIELSRTAGGRFEGQVTPDGGAAVGFSGTLELLKVLEDLADQAGRAPGAPGGAAG